jgi:hypothetical protein
MANYMKQLAEMLGLEWDDEKQESEEFKLSTVKDATYKLVEYEVRLKRGDDNWESIYYLGSILAGYTEIIKKQWKPQCYQSYYYPSITSLYDRYLLSIWKDDEIDNYRYKHGLVFKTKEEAIARANEILKMLEVNENDI